MLYLEKLYNCVYNLASFNGDKAEGADDEIILLSYTFIQSKPERIYSNSKYTELFLTQSQSLGIEGNRLTKLNLICNKMENIQQKDFYNLCESDYILMCDMVNKGILY